MQTIFEKQQNAETAHNAGLNCAQSVLKQFVDPNKLEEMLKISSGFGGGMKIGSVCGALSGGIMALGLKLASTDPALKKLIDEPVKDLVSRFAETMGHTDCLTIIGYNVNIPEQRELPACKGIMKEKCKLAIATAVQIVDEILAAKAAE